ncbi:MAG: 23S rRNA (adenine(2503)-C(2))-methyltransferase RlmN [Oligoflexales bacterium]|nr:23S rRNA (adenine(2503)-C(2))-methyltransferase RlmN [Oligoflexales bacterium]
MSLIEKSREELKEILCTQWGEPLYRWQQVCEWIFEHRVFRPEEMTNVPKSLRERIAKELPEEWPEVHERLDSEDGASKLLLRTCKNQMIEAVILRYEGRTSLCLSSQVGCRQACTFCQTGKLGFFRSLSSTEIMAQFAIAQSLLHAEGRRISHVVFMGMGEPLDNFQAVLKTVRLLIDEYGISTRKVTVSTAGVADKIIELAEQLRVALAISLHACRDELRSELMPINRRFPLAVLKESLLTYQKMTGDPLTMEYILIKDKNCSQREARELVGFLHGLRAKVNLIPFNHHPGLPYERPSDEDIRLFQSYLSKRGIPAPVRYSKGAQVSAACGQLAAKNKDQLHVAPERKKVVNFV